MKKATEIKTVYEWLIDCYNKSQTEISATEAHFGTSAEKLGIGRIYLTVSREHFYDKMIKIWHSSQDLI